MLKKIGYFLGIVALYVIWAWLLTDVYQVDI